ncbi:MFS transporter [Salinibacterium soli]|uniref:MFS transporter n=1 Tax=Antiquaquibacter soli TaxID=3064523 RepID=A0ABT9BN34_9MICO|nr:MFS transporter [Protaetiibacter sp. WY-16]MDO7882423.1 MFS transporter [Protaetiibacter sp. WY-16]
MSTTPAPQGLLSPALLWTTVGSSVLIFLGAFESLAVTTIMPTVSRELDGQALYALAFSATLAASIVGTVAGGFWADRAGPARPLLAGILVFLVGLVLSGSAAHMEVFVVGRFFQGLGSGAINVALYVVVARLYPASLHPRIFGLFATVWLIPSLIGPVLAGLIADTLSWHWVFLGVGVLVLIAAGAIIPSVLTLLRMPEHGADATSSRWIVPLSLVAAVGVLGVSLAGELGPLAWPVAVGALGVAFVALRPLFPRGTFRAARGMPAAIALRGVVASAFFAVEAFQPLLFQERFDYQPWAAGLILTVGGVAWAVSSEVQGRLGDRVGHEATLRLGTVLAVTGLLWQLTTTLLWLAPPIAAIGWLVAGVGMGLIYPRVSTVVLAHSAPGEQGFNSGAMSIADLAGAASSIAIAGLLFSAFGGVEGAGFTAVFVLGAALVLLTLPVAWRVRAQP